uniref:Uncharacterized protein n=1 Tax=Leersia perrieri TaxID=77586 RepID=A0A0D9V8T4_9ORYZ
MNEVRAREEEASCGGTEPKCPTHSSARGPCESSCERRAGIQSRQEEPQSELAIRRDQFLIIAEQLIELKRKRIRHGCGEEKRGGSSRRRNAAQRLFGEVPHLIFFLAVI